MAPTSGPARSAVQLARTTKPAVMMSFVANASQKTRSGDITAGRTAWAF